MSESSKNGEQSTVTSVNRWMRKMLRRASVDQFGNHYFLSWMILSENGLLSCAHDIQDSTGNAFVIIMSEN